jgi:hypothetical protein
VFLGSLRLSAAGFILMTVAIGEICSDGVGIRHHYAFLINADVDKFKSGDDRVTRLGEF